MIIIIKWTSSPQDIQFKKNTYENLRVPITTTVTTFPSSCYVHWVTSTIWADQQTAFCNIRLHWVRCLKAHKRFLNCSQFVGPCSCMKLCFTYICWDNNITDIRTAGNRKLTALTHYYVHKIIITYNRTRRPEKLYWPDLLNYTFRRK
jgi:hypothetical protein